MHRIGTPFKPLALVVLMYFSECVICNKVKFKLLGELGVGRRGRGRALNLENCAYSLKNPGYTPAGSQ